MQTLLVFLHETDSRLFGFFRAFTSAIQRLHRFNFSAGKLFCRVYPCVRLISAQMSGRSTLRDCVLIFLHSCLIIEHFATGGADFASEILAQPTWTDLQFFLLFWVTTSTLNVMVDAGRSFEKVGHQNLGVAFDRVLVARAVFGLGLTCMEAHQEQLFAIGLKHGHFAFQSFETHLRFSFRRRLLRLQFFSRHAAGFLVQRRVRPFYFSLQILYLVNHRKIEVRRLSGTESLCEHLWSDVVKSGVVADVFGPARAHHLVPNAWLKLLEDSHLLQVEKRPLLVIGIVLRSALEARCVLEQTDAVGVLCLV